MTTSYERTRTELEKKLKTFGGEVKTETTMTLRSTIGKFLISGGGGLDALDEITRSMTAA